MDKRKQEGRRIALELKAFRKVLKAHNICQLDFMLLIYIGRTISTYKELDSTGMTIGITGIVKRGYLERVNGYNRKFKASTKGLYLLDEYYNLLDSYLYKLDSNKIDLI